MTPTAFISYSWDDDTHKEWVKNLAERLRQDGVDVTLDKWATAPGDQLTTFMEQAIRENQFILIICTPNYKNRSDERKGGVGYEGDIMTAEAMTEPNHRKFIPVLRKGTWDEAAPSWLKGKYYINLSANPYSEENYKDLVSTLLGKRETAPPIGESMRTTQSRTTQRPKKTDRSLQSDFEDIKIVRVIVEDVTKPRNDGTMGSALYTIPFALSDRPPAEWRNIFINNWNHPPRYTLMHRPGIANIQDATVVLDGTTIEEVEQYHRDTLQLAVDKTNHQYREWRDKQEQYRAREKARREAHEKHIEDVSKRIKFD